MALCRQAVWHTQLPQSVFSAHRLRCLQLVKLQTSIVDRQTCAKPIQLSWVLGLGHSARIPAALLAARACHKHALSLDGCGQALAHVGGGCAAPRCIVPLTQSRHLRDVGRVDEHSAALQSAHCRRAAAATAHGLLRVHRQAKTAVKHCRCTAWHCCLPSLAKAVWLKIPLSFTHPHPHQTRKCRHWASPDTPLYEDTRQEEIATTGADPACSSSSRPGPSAVLPHSVTTTVFRLRPSSRVGR